MQTSRTARMDGGWRGFLFVVPHLVLFIVFVIIPIFYGLYISLTKWDLSGVPQFVGLQNYREILFNADSTFHFQFFNGMKNTAIYLLLAVPTVIVVPLLLALAMNTKIRTAGLFQSVFYMPGLFSISAIALVWLLIFNKRLGPLSNLLGLKMNWVSQQPYAWIMIWIVSMWAFIGGNLIIYRAALNGVPTELYEASGIDGAGPFRKFFHVTVPAIRFQLLYTLVASTIAHFSVYGQVRMLTKGGPVESTYTIIMYIRDLAFGSGKSIAGMASAQAMLLGLLMIVVSGLQFWLMSRNDKG